MKLFSSRRRVAVVVSVIATTAALFAPSAVAKSGGQPLFNCGSLGGSGVVTLFEGGLAKGHCSFATLPDLPGITLPTKPGAVNIACEDIAESLTLLSQGALQFEDGATGKVTLTPSGNVNVNCRNVVLAD